MGPVETRHFDGNDDDDWSGDDDSGGAKRIYDPGRSNWSELDLLPIAMYILQINEDGIWPSVFLLVCQPYLIQFVITFFSILANYSQGTAYQC